MDGQVTRLLGGRSCADHMLSTVLYLCPLEVTTSFNTCIAFTCNEEVQFQTVQEDSVENLPIQKCSEKVVYAILRDCK